MRYVNIALTIILVVLAYWLYRTIAEPIQFQKAKKKRYEAVIERLKDIKSVQMAYKGKYDEFVADFDSMINFIRLDTFQVVKVLGNPDDTTETVERDTLFVGARDSLFDNKTYPVESLAYIPFSGGKRFALDAGTVKRGRVTVPVFEVKAYDTVFLTDQPQQYVDREHYLGVGSMTKPSYVGNWK